MTTSMGQITRNFLRATTTTMAILMASSTVTLADSKPHVQIGTDLNSAENAFIQPSENNPDQSQQFSDVLLGGRKDDLLIGRLGVDVLDGGRGADILIGGTEHFNPLNRDKALGKRGADMFLWAPGDGSDFYDGGPGKDALVFGLMGEIQDGKIVFDVERDEKAGEIALDHDNLPSMDLTNSPGFCCIIDKSGPQQDRNCITNATAEDAAIELDRLGLDHLVQFILRNEPGAEDDVLAVTLSVKNTERLLCTSEDGGEIEVFNLRHSPPTLISKGKVGDLGNHTLNKRLHQIVQ